MLFTNITHMKIKISGKRTGVRVPEFFKAKDACEGQSSLSEKINNDLIKSAFKCDPNLWYMISYSAPILEERKGRCGGNFGNASCPIDPVLWDG